MLNRYDAGITLAFRNGQKIPLPSYYKNKIKTFVPQMTYERIKSHTSFEKKKSERDEYYKVVSDYCLANNIPTHFRKSCVQIFDSNINRVCLSHDDYSVFLRYYQQLINRDDYSKITETDRQ